MVRLIFSFCSDKVVCLTFKKKKLVHENWRHNEHNWITCSGYFPVHQSLSMWWKDRLRVPQWKENASPNTPPHLLLYWQHPCTSLHFPHNSQLELIGDDIKQHKVSLECHQSFNVLFIEKFLCVILVNSMFLVLPIIIIIKRQNSNFDANMWLEHFTRNFRPTTSYYTVGT